MERFDIVIVGGAGNDLLGNAVGSAVTDLPTLTVTAAGSDGLGRAIGGAAGSVLAGSGGQNSVAGRPGGIGPDILGVCEIENAHVVRLLAPPLCARSTSR